MLSVGTVVGTLVTASLVYWLDPDAGRITDGLIVKTVLGFLLALLTAAACASRARHVTAKEEVIAHGVQWSPRFSLAEGSSEACWLSVVDGEPVVLAHRHDSDCVTSG